MSENRHFFRDTVERILADTIDKPEIDAAEERILPAALSDALVENGILHMLVPEDAGGIGADIGDATAIMRAMGHAAAPGPVLETMLGNAMLAHAGIDLSEGLSSVVFRDDFAGHGDVRWADARLHDVRWSRSADLLLIAVNNDGRCQLLISKASEWIILEGRDAAGEPCDTLSAENVEFASFDIGEYAGWLHKAAILRGGQALGAMEWAFERSVEYAGERVQFGRPIGKFQAVQQMLAELAGHVLASAGIVDVAAETMRPALVAAARSRLGDAIDATIATTHQVHGALGYSREYALNSRTRRLMAWRDDYGSVAFWRRGLAGGFADLSLEQFWPSIADAGSPRPACEPS